MSFKVLFFAHATNADYKVHNSIIDTGVYKLFSYVVKNQEETLEVAKQLHSTESIDSIILCPGYSHLDVSEIFKALNGEVSVNVSRGDAASSRIAKVARTRT